MFRTSDPTLQRAWPLKLAWIAMLAMAGIWPVAQPRAQEDLTLPPRISAEAASEAPPTDTPTNSDSSPMEEIVVISDQNPWRLPDLGSAWRAREAAEQRDTGRISVDLAPLWDPDAEELPTHNPFAVTDGIRRVGFLEIFRVRFGGR